MKVVKIKHLWDNSIHCQYFCPGCGHEHAFSPFIHTYNDDGEKPTISPSLLHSNPQNHQTCHSFIKEGKIEFLSDCWHSLKGQIVELPEFDISRFDHKYVEILN